MPGCRRCDQSDRDPGTLRPAAARTRRPSRPDRCTAGCSRAQPLARAHASSPSSGSRYRPSRSHRWQRSSPRALRPGQRPSRSRHSAPHPCRARSPPATTAPRTAPPDPTRHQCVRAATACHACGAEHTPPRHPPSWPCSHALRSPRSCAGGARDSRETQSNSAWQNYAEHHSSPPTIKKCVRCLD